MRQLCAHDPNASHSDMYSHPVSLPQAFPHQPGYFGTVAAPSTSRFGGRYVGCYRDGKMEGTGAFYFRSGDYYDGEWKDNTMNGYGTMWHTQPTPLHPQGRAESGMWRDGVFLGR